MKNETLSGLYSIRAGMSLISQMHDDILAVKGEVDSQVSRIDALEKEKGTMQTQKDDLNKELLNAKKDLRVLEQPSTKSQNERDQKKFNEEHPFGCLFMIIFAIVALLATLLIGVIVFTLILRTSFPVWYAVVVIAAMNIFAFVGLIIYIVLSLRSDKKTLEYYRKKDIQKTKNMITELEKSIEDKSKELNKINMHILSAYEQRINLEQSLINTKNEKLSEAGKIYETMKGNFSGILDSRDWQNVDLIIYCFETGRAETLKEALQIVDKERQLNTLVSSIAYATSIISQEIRTNMEKISRDIRLGLGRLSSQIDKQNTLLQHISNDQKGILQKASDTAEETRFQSALLSKIDVSSHKLAEDMDYMIYRKKQL